MRKPMWFLAFAVMVVLSCGGEPSEERVTEVPEGDPWSEAASWPSGHVPQAGEDVTIPAGKQILLDVSPPALGTLTLGGTLVFDDKDLDLSATWILVQGSLRIGHPNRAYKNHATITLTGADPKQDVMGMGTRGIMVMDGGVLDLYGTPPKKTWSKIGAHLAAGDTKVQLLDDVGWKVGDQVVIAPTDYYRIGPTERLELSAATGSEIELAAGVAAPRWGVLQYVDEAGVTLEPTDSVTPSVIDERAEVGNLSRNIVIQAPNDDVGNASGFGAHVMVMSEGEAHVNGVEFHRVGQAGIHARYPMHWHLWSYTGSDPKGIPAKGQFIKNSAIWESSQRCVVVHATNGLTISGNVCYDVLAHAIFLEDAVERDNVIEDNLVLHVRKPAEATRLLNHDNEPAGLWLTNPDNVIRGNAVADSEGVGYWLGYPPAPQGASKAVPIVPSSMKFGEFSKNVAHSNLVHGMFFDKPPINDAGDTLDNSYIPTEDEKPGYVYLSYTIEGTTLYKHESRDQSPMASFWNRTKGATFANFVTADFNGTAFTGSSNCVIEGALVVGWTLNNANEPELVEGVSKTLPGAARLGAASYHSSCLIHNNTFVNLPAIVGMPSGAFGTSDYYFRGVDKGLHFNADNRLINAHPGFRSESPNTLPIGEFRGNYSLSGALWDPYGFWGEKGSYWVYDNAFFTEGTTCSEPLSPHGNDRSCVGPYYGVGNILLDGQDPNDVPGLTRPITITREDNGAVWAIDDGDCTPFLGHMRHFTTVLGGTYRVELPAGVTPGDAPDGTPGDTLTCDTLSPATPPTNWINFSVVNVLEDDDAFVMGVPYSGSTEPVVFATWRNVNEPRGSTSWTAYFNGDSNWQDDPLTWFPYESAADLAAVQASSGGRYWVDAANSLIWIKVARMGIDLRSSDDTEEGNLYKGLNFEIREE